jgi:hypothetical protein
LGTAAVLAYAGSHPLTPNLPASLPTLALTPTAWPS